MGATSYVFFGLMLIPLIAFLVWMIKQDKKKNYLGLFFLLFGIVIAIFTIIKLDKTFMENKAPQNVAPKASNFK